MKFKKGDILHCIWRDHCSKGSTWQTHERMLSHKLTLSESVSFYLGEDKKQMTLVQQHGLDGDDDSLVADAIIISKSDIISIKRLKKSGWS